MTKNEQRAWDLLERVSETYIPSNRNDPTFLLAVDDLFVCLRDEEFDDKFILSILRDALQREIPLHIIDKHEDFFKEMAFATLATLTFQE